MDAALLNLLKPILRLLVRRGVRIQSIISAVKELLLQVAQEELRSQGAKESVSRISVMTGIYRKDVQAFLDRGGKSRPRVPFLAKVIGQWRNDPRFYVAPGVPRALESIGKESEFVELILSVNREVNPYAVLFDLERLDFVENVDGVVSLKVEELVPEKNLDEAYSLIADDLEDLIEIVPENLISDTEIPQLHLKTSYDDIAIDKLPEIRLWILREGAEFHRRVRDYLSQFDRDLNPLLRALPGGARIALGTFARVPEVKKRGQ